LYRCQLTFDKVRIRDLIAFHFHFIHLIRKRPDPLHIIHHAHKSRTQQPINEAWSVWKCLNVRHIPR
jgi:hypothetical protein